MGTQKNHLNEAVLLSTQNICQKLWVRKYLQFYAENFCLSKPVSPHVQTDLSLPIIVYALKDPVYNMTNILVHKRLAGRQCW